MNAKAKNVLRYVCMAILFAGFLAIMILVANKYSFKIDKFISFLSKHRHKFITSSFKILTHLGSVVVLGVFSLIFLLANKNKKDGFFALINLVLVAVVCTVVKYIVRRARPEGFMLIEEVGFSFPSAHAALSAAFYGALAYLSLKRLKNKPLKITLVAILLLLPIFIGFTRIYLGVHFPSDILAGLLLGGALTILSSVVYEKIIKH